MVDPFIDLISKAGLFVFAVFSIGILWTIISLEIVDSRKEIGILRSIGLSGLKVSYIYIFQTLVTGIIALTVAFFVSRYAINFYNGQIMDQLQQIHLSMYSITYRTPLYLVIFLIIICTISLFYPLYKIMSQKIVDIINERSQL
jgi:putative ABC transport system permease protein